MPQPSSHWTADVCLPVERWQVGTVPSLLASMLMLLVIGCGSDNVTTEPKPSELDSATRSSEASGIDKDSIQRILDRYVKSSAYSDIANISLTYKRDGQPVDEPASIAVQFQRPNRIRLEIKRGINVLRLISDGKQMWTTIEDPVTDNLGHQIVQQAAPERLTTAQIYAATELVDPSQPDEALSALFGMPLSLELSQVGLLLDGLAFRHLLTNATEVKRLDDQTINDSLCQRYRMTSTGGDFTFWWDSQQACLRRIEYPSKGLEAQLSEGSRVEDTRFQVEFDSVQFAQPDASVFAFEPPSDSTLVRFFVLPPLQLPTGKYNENIPDFSLTTLDGDRESSGDWAGKLKVLTWFNDHPTSRSALPQVGQVMREFGSDQIVYRSVFAEPAESVSNDRLRELTQRWGVTVPVVRDLTAVGRDQFEITDAPTTVILDQNSRLQAFVVGASPQLRQTLTRVLQRLRAGEDVAADVQKRLAAEQAAFEKQLSMARITVDPAQVPLATLAEASEPQKLSKTLLWQADGIESPGNLLVLNEAAKYRCLVLDGMRRVVELDEQGEVIDRHELQMDETSGVSRLRTAIDEQGRRFYLGFVQFGDQLHVFDHTFRHRLSYPETAQQNARILDAQIIDLDQDGELELYVGFADPVGLHRVNLQGQRQWSNRASAGVVSLVPRWLAQPTYLLTTNDEGAMGPISASGREGPSISVRNRLIHQLAVSGAREARSTQFVGMSLTLEGRLIAVGLDPQLKEAWSYGLPGGTYSTQIDTPISAELLGGDSRQWIIAGPDGSVHVVDDDGSFFDFFNTGHQINGISAYNESGAGRLVVSSPGSVTVYELRR